MVPPCVHVCATWDTCVFSAGVDTHGCVCMRCGVCTCVFREGVTAVILHSFAPRGPVQAAGKRGPGKLGHRRGASPRICALRGITRDVRAVGLPGEPPGPSHLRRDDGISVPEVPAHSQAPSWWAVRPHCACVLCQPGAAGPRRLHSCLAMNAAERKIVNLLKAFFLPIHFC